MEKRTSIDGSRTSFDKKDPPAVQNQPQATNSPPQQQVDLSKFGLPEEESLVTCKRNNKEDQTVVLFENY